MIIPPDLFVLMQNLIEIASTQLREIVLIPEKMKHSP
jgi:hypothetical protein